jgi:Phage Mu protein F like protein
MTTAPVVELRFNPTGLRPSDIPTAGAFLGSPADAIEAALAVARAAMVDQMRAEIRGLAEPTHSQILRIADLAWQMVAWKYRKISAPIMADAYIHAYRAADAGDVPMSMIYDLAEKHADKVGDYFHTSSRDALIEGFNSLVNRRIPAKAAADRVLDAYGLTSRQTRTYVAAKQFQTPVSDVLPRSIKAKARAYIDKAFTGRIRKLSKQEEHNIDEQAKQLAWMWLQQKGRLNEKAEKIWITAKDERVCPVCGPLHGKKVKVNERFVTAQGEFWTPGLHPNCRCVVRLLEHTFSKDLYGTALAEFNEEHPRGEGGRFGHKTQTKERPYTAVERSTDTELERMFQAVVSGSIQPQAIAQTVKPLYHPLVISDRPKVRPQVQTVRPQVKTQRPQVITAKPEVKAETITRTKPKAKAAAKVDTSTVTTTQGAPSKAPSKRGLWAVVGSEAFDPNRRKLQLDTGMKIYPDLNAANRDVQNLIQGDIKDQIGRIKGRGSTFTESTTKLDYRLTDEQVKDVVEYQARRGQLGYEYGTEPVQHPVETELITVHAVDVEGRPLLDERGDPVINSFSPDYVGRLLGVKPDYFDLKIVQVDPKHAKPGGAPGLASEPGEMAGSKKVSFEGQFRPKPGGYRRRPDEDITVEVIEVEPADKPKKPKGRPKKKPD